MVGGCLEGCPYDIIPYDSVGDISRYDGYVISGRRRNIPHMNVVNSRVIRHAISYDKPLLAICYGMEMLVLCTGGTIRRMPGAIKGMRDVCLYGGVFGCGVIQVYQSHRYQIGHIPDGMAVLGSSDTCKYEVVQYDNMAIYGTQFHPEMSPDGTGVVQKFLRVSNLL